MLMADDVVTLDGSGSSDPLGRQLHYRWSLENNGPAAVTPNPPDSTLSQSSFTVPAAGTYVFKLVVYVLVDGQEIRSASDYVSISTGQAGTVFGHVYLDGNGNGQYDTGEGLEDATVSAGGSSSTNSGSDGVYSLELPPSTYTLVATKSGYNSARRFNLEIPPGGNVRVDLTLTTGDANCRTLGSGVEVCASDLQDNGDGTLSGSSDIRVGSHVLVEGSVLIDTTTDSVSGDGTVYFVWDERTQFPVFEGSYSLPTDSTQIQPGSGAASRLVELAGFQFEGNLPTIELDVQDHLTLLGGQIRLPRGDGDVVVVDINTFTIDGSGSVSGSIAVEDNLKIGSLTLSGVSADFNNTGLRVNGTLQLPPNVQGDSNIQLTNLQLTRSGWSVDAVDLTNVKFDVAGLTVSVTDAHIDPDQGILVSGQTSGLPADITTNPITFSQLLLTDRGVEGGQIDVQNLTMKVGGATLSFEEAQIEFVDVNTPVLMITKARLDMPPSLGKGFAEVKDLKVTGNSVAFARGEIVLPEIRTGNVIISDARVVIEAITQGYAFTGGGRLTIQSLEPGRGAPSISAEVKFSLYEGGQQEWNYVRLFVSGVRVPLGSTGFFITGLGGEIDFDYYRASVRMTFEGGPNVAGITALSGSVDATISFEMQGWFEIKGELELFTYRVTSAELSLNKPGVSDNGVRGTVYLDVFAIIKGDATLYIYRSSTGEMGLEGSGHLLVQIPYDDLPDWAQVIARKVFGIIDDIPLGEATATLGNGLTLSEAEEISGTPTAEGDYRFTVRVSDGSGQFDSQRLTLRVSTSVLPTLGLRVFLHGYYDFRAHTSRPANVTVELRDADFPQIVRYSFPDVALGADGRVLGTSQLKLQGVALGLYRIAIKHHNHLAVITALPYTLSAGTVTTVDFTVDGTAYRPPGPSYDDPMWLELDGVKSMRAGDIDQDGVIFISDYSRLAQCWNTSTEECDLDGDGIVFIRDYSLLAQDWNTRSYLPEYGY